MERPLDDSTEVIVFQDGLLLNPEYAFPEILRRAFRHGKRSRTEFALWSFAEIESELQAGWVLNGEMTEWSDVRMAVQQGFEHGRDATVNPRE